MPLSQRRHISDGQLRLRRRFCHINSTWSKSSTRRLKGHMFVANYGKDREPCFPCQSRLPSDAQGARTNTVTQVGYWYHETDRSLDCKLLVRVSLFYM